jgi:hypothetical protein
VLPKSRTEAKRVTLNERAEERNMIDMVMKRKVGVCYEDRKVESDFAPQFSDFFE